MDQFYTKDHVAAECYQKFVTKVDTSHYDIILEPSAGKGSFFKLLQPDAREGLDIDPKADFL
jgi:hypothetical protein